MTQSIPMFLFGTVLIEDDEQATKPDLSHLVSFHKALEQVAKVATSAGRDAFLRDDFNTHTSLMLQNTLTGEPIDDDGVLTAAHAAYHALARLEHLMIELGE